MTTGRLQAFQNWNINMYNFNNVDFNTGTDPDVCPVCREAQSKNPHTMDSPYKPPMHPRCRCAVAPYIGRSDSVRRNENAPPVYVNVALQGIS